MNLAELAEEIRSGAEPSLEIHALTPSMYVVFRAEGSGRTPLRQGDQTQAFSSRFAAMQALRDAGARRASFVHLSAYDEMVNAPGGGTNELREPVDLTVI
jgi:hypothetical protein